MHPADAQNRQRPPRVAQSPAALVLEQLLILCAAALAVYAAQYYRLAGREESMWWFPAGLGIGLAMRLGLRALPALFLGAVLAYIYQVRIPAAVALWTSATWMLSIAVATDGMRRFAPSDLLHHPVKSLICFYVLGAIVAPLIHTVLDYPVLIRYGLISGNEDIRAYVAMYWLGEALGALVLAPAIYLMGRDFSPVHSGVDAPPASRLALEKCLWTALAGCLCFVTLFLGDRLLYAGIIDMEFLLFPMLAWSALRLGIMFTNLAALMVGAFVVLCSLFSIGGTPSPASVHDIVSLAIFIASISIMAQLLAAAVHERGLRASETARAAGTDWISGLPNFRLFREKLFDAQRAMARGEPASAVGLIVIDVQETLLQAYGLEARNTLLAQFGAAIRTQLDSTVVVSRIATGSYALLFRATPVDAARRTLEALAPQLDGFVFTWAERRLRLRAKYAISALSGDGEPQEALLAQAVSLQTIAPEPGARVAVIAGTLATRTQALRAQVDALSELQEALSQDHFRLYVQPVVNLQNPAVTTRRFEALIRMVGRNGEIVPPGRFLPVAEAFGLTTQIDLWVLQRAVDWLASGDVPLDRLSSISLNLSAKSIDDNAFRESLVKLLANSGVPASKITFEITETVAFVHVDQARSFLELLRSLGCRLALDDFGTGVASFEYLKALPVHEVKIDGAFVRDLKNDPMDRAIVLAVKEVALALGIGTVAEFVEDAATADLLRDYGIDFGQGYFFGKPIPIETIDWHAAPRDGGPDSTSR